MILLTATTHSISLNTASAVDVDYICNYVDLTTSSFTPGSTQGSIITATDTTILAAPAASTQRQVKYIAIHNIDSTSNVVIISKIVSGSPYKIAEYTLAAGETLEYTDGNGFQIFPQASGGGGGAVDSVNGHTGVVVLTADDIIPGLTADASELNILDGATLTTTELNYVDGVTSSIQTQLDGKAPSLGTDDNYVTDAEKVKLSNLSGTNTGDQNLFSTIAVSGQSNVVADSTTDTLTLAAGTNITITTDASTDTVTIAATGGVSDGDKGDITVASSGTVWTIDTPSSVTVAANDKVLIKDTSNSDSMAYVTTQNIRDLTTSARGFRANRSTAQTLSTGTQTKIQFTNEDFDTNNEYDNSTNYRFTPAAGKYLISASVGVGLIPASAALQISIYKNGSAVSSVQYPTGNATANPIISVVDILSANGTDYFEIFVIHSSGANRDTLTTFPPFFAGLFLGT